MKRRNNIDGYGCYTMHQKLLNSILPPRCPITGEIVDTQGILSPEAWKGLDFIQQPCCHSCGHPFEFEVEEFSTCATCLDNPPQYHRARAALSYNDTSRQLVLKFKHGDHIHIVSSLLPFLMQAGTDILAETDLILPVPLHFWRLIKRRYNQAGILAKNLSKETGIPWHATALVRTRPTQAQGHMDAKSRRKNVRQAFAVKPKYEGLIEGKVITIIDDVYTTGATVNECAKVLKKAGARRVNILTVAKVVRDS